MKQFMEKLKSYLENSVGKVALTLSNQRHMSALRNGMMFTLPFTLLGGIVMIIMYPPITDTLQPSNPIYEFLIAWKSWGATTELLKAPYYLTLGMLSIYTVFGISFNLSKSLKINQGYASLIALCTFLCIAAAPFRGSDKVWSIALTYLDAQGMFLGIIVSMVTVEITGFFIRKGVGIKLPDSVPPNITAVFEYLFPLVANIVLFIGLNELCKAGMGYGLVSLIQNLIAPLLSFTDSLPSVIIINLFVIGFWFFGIHGAALVASIIGPIQATNLATNAAAMTASTLPSAVLAGSFKSIFATQIMYNALLFTVLLVAKSPRLRSICKLSLVPNIFNINEPMIFGLPMVMNVVLIIPILVTTIIDTAIFYLLMTSDVIGKVYIATVATFPAPINAFLSTMDWKAPIVWILLLVMNILIFVPFVKVFDKQAIAEDARSMAEASE